jgi:hypothetical protein
LKTCLLVLPSIRHRISLLSPGARDHGDQEIRCFSASKCDLAHIRWRRRAGRTSGSGSDKKAPRGRRGSARAWLDHPASATAMACRLKLWPALASREPIEPMTLGNSPESRVLDAATAFSSALVFLRLYLSATRPAQCRPFQGHKVLADRFTQSARFQPL